MTCSLTPERHDFRIGTSLSAIAAATAVALVSAACGPDGAVGPEAQSITSALVLDGHQGGHPGFEFLFPMAPVRRSVVSDFDPNVEPSVVVCELDGDFCRAGPSVVEFSFGPGHRFQAVKLRRRLRAYEVWWKTTGFHLDPEALYRVQVRVGDIELGFADVRVIGSLCELFSTDRNEFIPIRADGILPIRFRIGRRAVEAAEPVVTPAGGRISLGSGIFLTSPPGAVSSDTPLSGRLVPPEEVTPILDSLGLFDSVLLAAVELLPSGTTFDRPVRVRVPLLAPGEGNVPALSIIDRADRAETIEPTRIVVDRLEGYVEFDISHFTTAVVSEKRQQTDPSRLPRCDAPEANQADPCRCQLGIFTTTDVDTVPPPEAYGPNCTVVESRIRTEYPLCDDGQGIIDTDETVHLTKECNPTLSLLAPDRIFTHTTPSIDAFVQWPIPLAPFNVTFTLTGEGSLRFEQVLSDPLTSAAYNTYVAPEAEAPVQITAATVLAYSHEIIALNGQTFRSGLRQRPLETSISFLVEPLPDCGPRSDVVPSAEGWTCEIGISGDARVLVPDSPTTRLQTVVLNTVKNVPVDRRLVWTSGCPGAPRRCGAGVLTVDADTKGATFVGQQRGIVAVTVQDAEFPEIERTLEIRVQRITDTFVLGGLAPWTPTGVVLDAGEPVTIVATGWVSTAPLADFPAAISGPDGQFTLCPGPNSSPSCALNGAPYGLLLGRVGPLVFRVGSSYDRGAQASGPLSIAINDNLGFYFDNGGSYNVRIIW